MAMMDPPIRWLRLTLAVLACGLAPAALRAADGPERVLVFFGDSLTAGYGLADPDTQSFPAVIQAKIEAAHLRWRVVNAGLSGETSAGGLRRVDWILRQRIDLFVLELGANDGLRGTPPEVTRSNLQGIITRVRTTHPAARIILAGMRMPASMGQDYDQAFAAVFPGLAKSNDVVLVPFLLQDVAGRPELNQADSIHPNAAGASLVAETLWSRLRPLLD